MQTGNVIFLGLGVAGVAGAPVLAPLVALCAFLVGGTAAALPARTGRPGATRRLRLAMGLRNTIARGIGDPNLATTVLNLTLGAFVSSTPTGIASESELGLRAAAIAAILAGAIAGALLLKASLALAIVVAAAVVAAAAISDRGSPSGSTEAN